MRAFVKKIVHSILVRTFPSKMGYNIKPKGEGYFHAGTIVQKANKKGLSVAEYLEKYNIGGVGKRRDEIILKLKDAGVMKQCEAIVEIGAGTGMYLEKFIAHCNPSKYEVYETDKGWSKYLSFKYTSQHLHLKVHNADGSSLQFTADNSSDIVAAHAVFVYLPIVITIQYLQEAVRVCKKNGHIIFDCFTDGVFTFDEISNFSIVNPNYTFPVIITEELINQYCTKFNLQIVSSFNINYHLTQSTYFILKKL